VRQLRSALGGSQRRVEELEGEILSHGHNPRVTSPVAAAAGSGFQSDTEGLLLDLPPNPLDR